MASIDDTTGLSGRLVPASEVQGASVHDTARTKIGTVHDVMIDKANGRVAYVVLAYGGLLGIGARHYPVPWDELTYDPDLPGYVVDVDRDTLEGGPSFADEAAVT